MQYVCSQQTNLDRLGVEPKTIPDQSYFGHVLLKKSNSSKIKTNNFIQAEDMEFRLYSSIQS